MMYPVLCKIKFESLHRVFQSRAIWWQIVFSVVVNWIVAPFLMVSSLAFVFWFCFLVSFSGFVACSYTLDRDRHGWIMATVTRSGSPGHFYQIKMVCAKA